MNTIYFNGTIYCDNYETIVTILKQWIKKENFEIKIKLLDEEIRYEDERIYLFCQSGLTNLVTASFFLLEGNIFGHIHEAKELLQQLFKLCQKQNINSTFEYFEVNEDGEAISEEFYIE